MFNLRYHVVSLVAVFLALAVGLLLGSVVQERGVIDKQKTRVLDSLRKDFEEIRADNDKMRGAEDFANDSAAALIAGRLEGKRVVVIANAGRVDGLEGIRETVERAGAAAAVATFRHEGGGLVETMSEASITTTGGGEDIGAAADLLAFEWTTPGAREFTDALVSRGELFLEGLPPASGVDAVVIMASWNGKADADLLRVAEALQRRRAVAVGVQTSARPTGVARAASDAGLSAVDHMGTPQGRTALVWLLSGKARGYFGTGPGAEGHYPRLDR